MRQPGLCVRALRDSDALFQRSRSKLHTPHSTLHTALFTLHTSHLHFTLHTSSLLIWALLTSSQLFSSHLISSHLISSHMSPKLNCSTWALLNLSHLFEAPLNSSQLFCVSQSFCRQRQVSCTQKWMRREAFAHRSLRHRCVYTEKPLHKESFCTWEAFTHSTLLKFYTDIFLTRSNFLHSKLVHTESVHAESFYTQKAFTHSRILHAAIFYTEKLFTQQAFTHRSFYTKHTFVYT